MGLHTTHTRWLVHSWSTLGIRMSHGQHGHTRFTMARTWGKVDLGEATTFPLIVYSVAGHGAYIQMVFLHPEIAPTRTPATLEPHNFTSRPWIEMRFKAKL